MGCRRAGWGQLTRGAQQSPVHLVRLRGAQRAEVREGRRKVPARLDPPFDRSLHIAMLTRPPGPARKPASCGTCMRLFTTIHPAHIKQLGAPIGEQAAVALGKVGNRSMLAGPPCTWLLSADPDTPPACPRQHHAHRAAVMVLRRHRDCARLHPLGGGRHTAFSAAAAMGCAATQHGDHRAEAPFNA